MVIVPVGVVDQNLDIPISSSRRNEGQAEQRRHSMSIQPLPIQAFDRPRETPRSAKNIFSARIELGTFRYAGRELQRRRPMESKKPRNGLCQPEDAGFGRPPNDPPTFSLTITVITCLLTPTPQIKSIHYCGHPPGHNWS